MALNYLQWDGFEETVTTEALYAKYVEQCGFWGLPARGTRRFLDFLQDLEMHGLIGSKVESSGRHGRRKFTWTQADLLEVRGAAFGYLQSQSPGPSIPGLSAADGGLLSPYLDPD